MEGLSDNDKALFTVAVTDIKDGLADVPHIAENKVDKHNIATVAALHSDVINIQSITYI